MNYTALCTAAFAGLCVSVGLSIATSKETNYRAEATPHHLLMKDVERPMVTFYSSTCNDIYDRIKSSYKSGEVLDFQFGPDYEGNLRRVAKENDINENTLRFDNCNRPSKKMPRLIFSFP